MRQVLLAVLGLALLVLAAAPAFAGEVCEGDGYKVKIPDGFTEAMSMSGQGTMKIESRLGSLPIDGMPETTIYIAGDMTHPRGSAIVARVNIKSGHEVSNLDDLGMEQLELMRSRMPEGFEVTVRKVGKYDAIEMTMSMEMMEEEMTMRMLSVAGGDFVMVLMLQTNDDDYPAADSMWEGMIASLELSSRTNKIILYGGIGLGALGILFVLAKVAGSVGGGGGGYVEVNDWRTKGSPASNFEAPSRLGAARARPNQLPAVPDRPAARPPTDSAPPMRTPTGGRPQVTPAGKPGLRSTLPPSGHWTDGSSG